MEMITRKTMLYKTGVEYGDYTMNHVLGCSHGCCFPCYAQMMAKRFGTVKTYEEWCKPKLVANTLELLDREIPRLKGKIKTVHLCFTTDPFMVGYDEVTQMSIASIKKLNDAGIPCTVLTKGILPIELASLSDEIAYGITLISLFEEFRNGFEPNSAPYAERLEALRKLHELGCSTWVSIEPYPTPNLIEQRIDDILNAVGFVDKIIFGRMHYNKMISAYKTYKVFYNELSKQVISFCANRKIQCHIKSGTTTLI